MAGEIKILHSLLAGLASEKETLHSLLAGLASERKPYTASCRPGREKRILHSLLAGRGGRLATIPLGI